MFQSAGIKHTGFSVAVELTEYSGHELAGSATVPFQTAQVGGSDQQRLIN